MADTKVAIVTGGEKGIGRAISERLLGEGWQVVVAGIDETAFFQLGKRHFSSGALHFMPCDVRDEKAVSVLFKIVANDFGRLDALVLNAGIASPARIPVSELLLEEWRNVIDVNLTGPFLCAKHGARILKKFNGNIVAIASTRASMSESDTFAYSASKGGLISLAHSLSVSLGPEVRVNSVSPGWIHEGEYADLKPSDHDQHPVGRVGHPGDVANMVSFLLGPDSGFVTGQNFVVDGGMTKKMIYSE